MTNNIHVGFYRIGVVLAALPALVALLACINGIYQLNNWYAEYSIKHDWARINQNLAKMHKKGATAKEARKYLIYEKVTLIEAVVHNPQNEFLKTKKPTVHLPSGATLTFPVGFSPNDVMRVMGKKILPENTFPKTSEHEPFASWKNSPKRLEEQALHNAAVSGFLAGLSALIALGLYLVARAIGWIISGFYQRTA